jgi:hypothetical protein
MKYICFTHVPEAKITPKDSDGFSTLQNNSDTGDENSVSPFKTSSSSDDSHLVVQDIETNVEPEQEPEPEKISPAPPEVT